MSNKIESSFKAQGNKQKLKLKFSNSRYEIKGFLMDKVTKIGL